MQDNFFNLEEDIPQQFYSDSNSAPFNQCSVCERDLGQGIYVIEKSFKQYPNQTETYTVFEYAMCLSCKQEMMNQISSESMQKIKEYVQENQANVAQLLSNEPKPNIQSALEHCSFTKKHISQMEEYNIIGFFKGNKMVQIPFVFGEQFINEYANLLSDETLDFFDDFMNRINDLPPALAKLLDKKSPVII